VIVLRTCSLSLVALFLALFGPVYLLLGWISLVSVVADGYLIWLGLRLRTWSAVLVGVGGLISMVPVGFLLALGRDSRGIWEILAALTAGWMTCCLIVLAIPAHRALTRFKRGPPIPAEEGAA